MNELLSGFKGGGGAIGLLCQSAGPSINPNLDHDITRKVYCTPDRRQSKTHLTIDERGPKVARNSVFDWRQKTFNKNFDCCEGGNKCVDPVITQNVCNHTSRRAMEVMYNLFGSTKIKGNS